MKALALVLLAGCGLPPPLALPDDHQRIKDATEAGWRAAGLPEPGECLRRARIEWAPDARAFAGRCGAPATYAAACLAEDKMQVGLRVHGAPVAVLRPGQPLFDSTGSPALHEWLHALSSCSGMGLDQYHLSPRVWTAKGGAASAQGRARDMLQNLPTSLPKQTR